MAEVHLHDEQGAFIESVEVNGAPAANTVIERNGRIYVWNQRNGHFRQAAEVLVALSKPLDAKPVEAPSPSKDADDDNE